MSAEAVQQVIGQAVTSSEFAKQLFENPDAALAGFDLTEEEKAAIKAMKKEDVEKFHATLDERISKSGSHYRASPGGGTWSH